MGHTGSPFSRFSTYRNGGLDRAAVDVDVGQNRRARDVHVPQAVMDQLEVPLALAGLQIDGDKALAEEAIPRAVAAVVVARRQFHRQVDETQIFVHRNLSPDAGVSRVGPGFLLPGVIAVLTSNGNGVEDPEALAGAHVESADVALHVFSAVRHATGQVRGTDNHDIFRDDGRRVQADFAGDEIDVLIVVFFQVHDAVHAERGNRQARLSVQRDQAITRSDV